MNFKASRQLQFYYTLVLLVTLSAFGYGVKYFWDNGPFNVDNVNSTFESSLHFDELRKSDSMKILKSLVNEDRSRDAIRKLNELEKRSSALNSGNEVDSFNNLKSSIATTKGHLNELISFPQMGNVILVLANKISSFQSFVVQNNWRTLTRISKRMKNRFSGRAIQTPGFFTYRKLNNVLSLTKRDISLMEKVTTGSVLSSRDKQNILGKAKTFTTEVRMLERYLVALKNFNGSFKTMKNRYQVWFQEIAPQITLTKIKMEKDTKIMVFSLLGLGAFLLISLMAGFFIYARGRESQRKEFEASVLKMVQDGLFPFENKANMSEANENFKSEFERCREYFHKRISFGTVFQEAVPFSSLLLDSNLNLSWANELFYEHWNLDETHRERNTITWDFLQQYTNLGEDDPVLMALNQGIAGIYQIQLQNPVSGECLPYEMYVSPVEYSKQKRIMIFFYPLRSLEETLTNQTKAIVGPIRNTLDSFIQDGFNEELQQKLRKDFEVAGIGELFLKFNEYYEKNNYRIEELSEEIKNLEDTLNDQNGLIEDFDAINDRKSQLQSESKSGFDKTKTAIIHNIDLRYEMEGLFNKTLNLTKSLMKKEQELLSASEKSNAIIDENKQAFAQVNKVRDDFKSIKNATDDVRARLNQSLEQTLMFIKKETNIDPRLEGSIGKVRLEMKGVEQLLQNFSRVIRSLDVSIGKMELIAQQSDAPNLSSVSEELGTLGKNFEDSLFEFGRISRSGQKTDEVVVESLKGLYDCFRLTEELTSTSSDLIDNFYKDEELTNVIFTEAQELDSAINKETHT
ncbi:MAG: hypothetical protein NXH75_03455 [Halobacteriovoraceae bacterium]|nr:hypothetical protein [Halobacteriovoraceae bacterium]